MIERLLAADAALERDDLDAAQHMFTQVADADPRNAIAVVGLARVAARRGANDEAEALARRALDIDPDEAAAGRLLDELGRAGAIPSPAGPAPTPQQSAEPKPAPPNVAPPSRPSFWRRLVDRFLRRG